MTSFFLLLASYCVVYIIGVRDGLKGRPPEPLRGNYEHTEDIHEDEDIY